MISQIANATEKTIRYLIPGLWIYILFLAKNNNALFENSSKLEMGLFSNSIFLGIISFIIYRQIFDVFENAVINRWDIKKLRESFDRIKESDENYNDYIYLKFAFVHMEILLPILSFIAMAFTNEKFFNIPECWFVIMNFILLVIGFVNYGFMYKIVNYKK